MVNDTNLYITGTDSQFYHNLCKEKLSISDDKKGAFRIYHLYGAHSPYYLTENATLDFESGDPITQWKGCMRITYEYIEQLRDNGLYEDATIIITADHGLNRTQRTALKDKGITVTDDSNPIFIIKRAGEKRKSIEVIDKEVTDDSFTSTILKSINPTDTECGKAIWEY